MKLPVFAILLVSITVFLHGGLAEQCGSQAGGATCPNGLCCSQWGYCGCTQDYCGAGCQSQCGGCPSQLGGGVLHGVLAEQCGSQAGGATCPNGLCCSQWGYCGCTQDYCGAGCQSQCGGCPSQLGGGVLWG